MSQLLGAPWLVWVLIPFFVALGWGCGTGLANTIGIILRRLWYGKHNSGRPNWSNWSDRMNFPGEE